ncbi:hypothetical protein VTO42DRAFT_7592 [Malbranchea cinnamomea]
MARNPGAFPALLALLNHLRRALATPTNDPLERIRIPHTIVTTICRSRLEAETPEIYELVRMIDGQNRYTLNRLDGYAFHAVIHVLFTGATCDARDRGLFLCLKTVKLMTRISETHDDPTLRENANRAKTILGRRLFPLLFDNLAEGSELRRYAGEFVLELTRSTRINIRTLEQHFPIQLQTLGRIILEYGDHSVAFVCGLVVRGIIGTGLGTARFWPEDAHQEHLVNFPLSIVPDDVWLRMFVNLRQVIDRQRRPGRRHHRILLIRTIEVQGLALGDPCPAPMVMAFHRSSIIFLAIQDYRPIVVEVPFAAISVVQILDNKVKLLLSYNGYYITNGQQRRVDHVIVNPFLGLPAEQIVPTIRAHVYGEPPERPPYLYRNTRRRRHWVAGPFNLSSSMHGGASASYQPYYHNHGAQNLNFGQVSSSQGQYATATVELPTTAEIEQQNENLTLDNQPATTDVPDSQIAGPSGTHEVAEPATSNETGITGAASNVGYEPGLSYNTTTPAVATSAGDDSANAAAGINIGQEPQENVEGNENSAPADEAPFPLEPIIGFHSEGVNDTPAPDNEAVSNLLGNDLPVTAVAPNGSGDQPHAVNGRVENQNELSVTKGKTGNVDNPEELNTTRTPEKSTRLRRPTRKTIRPVSRKSSVDWSQDLRVNEEEIRASILAKAKKKGNSHVLEKFQDVKVSSLKGHAHRKKFPAAKSRPRREITRTLASARCRRIAAEKAKEKLALATECESPAYDPDDPIETSSVAAPDAGTTEVEGRIARLGLNVPDGSKGRTTDRVEYEVGIRTSTPGDEDDSSVDEDNAKAQRKSVTFKDALETDEKDEAHETHIPTGHCPGHTLPKSVSLQTVRATDEGTGNMPESHCTGFGRHGIENEQSEPPTPSRAARTSLGRKLSDVLSRAGIKKTQSSDVKDQVHPERLSRGVSNVSKKVSEFISKQRAVGLCGNTGEGDGNTAATVCAEEHAPAPLSEETMLQQASGHEEEPSRDDAVSDEVENETTGRSQIARLHDQGENVNEVGGLSNLHAVALDDFSTGHARMQSAADHGTFGDASTLVVESTLHSTPSESNGSSSLCEVTKEDFLSRRSPGRLSISPGVSTAFTESPCPKNRGESKQWKTDRDKVATPPAMPSILKTPRSKDGRPTLNTSGGLKGLLEGVNPRDFWDDDETDISDSEPSSPLTRKRPQPKSHSLPPASKKYIDSSRMTGNGVEREVKHPVRNAFVERLRAATDKRAAESHNVRGDRMESPSSADSDYGYTTSSHDSKLGSDTQTHLDGHNSSGYTLSQSTMPAANKTWIETLRASEKRTLDILVDTSHRLVRHMADEEKAIYNVVKKYQYGMERIQTKMRDAHDDNLAYARSIQRDMEKKVVAECQKVLARLEEDRKEILAVECPIREDNLLREIEDAIEELDDS